MKSTVLTGISLTLFMLLLVMAAAFVFLFQGRAALEQRADRYQAEAEAVQTELAAEEAARTTVEASLAAAETDSVLLEGQLVDSQRQLEELAGRADTLAAELESVNSALAQQLQAEAQRTPQVVFVTPNDGDSFLVDEPVELLVVAGDAAGVAAVSLRVNGDSLGEFPANNQQLFTLRQSWTPSVIGAFDISAAAENGNGAVSSPVTVTVQVVDLETHNRSLLTQIETDVARLRGMTPPPPASITMAAPQAPTSAARVPNAAAIDSLQTEARLLSAFDFVPADYDLSRALADLTLLVGEPVHGPDSAAFVTLADDGGLDAAARWAYMHNYVHLLQDTQYELPPPANDVAGEDGRRALDALIEGEAGLVADLFLEQGYFSEVESAEIMSLQAAEMDDELEPFPPFLVNLARFPRESGLAFARALYEQQSRGLEAVDVAWESPPQSTEQILHPERYLSGDAPQSVTLPDLVSALGSDWSLLGERSMGEFLLRQYLRQQLSDADAEAAAAGWGGDRYAVYWSQGLSSPVLIWRLTWDTAADSAEFAAAYPNYPTRLFGASGEPQPNGGECWQGEDVICFYPGSAASLIVRAPDNATAAAVAARTQIEG